MAGSGMMIDEKTLEKIKNKEFGAGTNFPEEVHRIIHGFYKNFDLDRQDNKYRQDYITHFVEQNEDFIINYVTNVYNPNIKTTDKLSDEITFNKFLDTLGDYLTKYYYEDERNRQ